MSRFQIFKGANTITIKLLSFSQLIMKFRPILYRNKIQKNSSVLAFSDSLLIRISIVQCCFVLLLSCFSENGSIKNGHN